MQYRKVWKDIQEIWQTGDCQPPPHFSEVWLSPPQAPSALLSSDPPPPHILTSSQSEARVTAEDQSGGGKGSEGHKQEMVIIVLLLSEWEIAAKSFNFNILTFYIEK